MMKFARTLKPLRIILNNPKKLILSNYCIPLASQMHWNTNTKKLHNVKMMVYQSFLKIQID